MTTDTPAWQITEREEDMKKQQHYTPEFPKSGLTDGPFLLDHYKQPLPVLTARLLESLDNIVWTISYSKSGLTGFWPRETPCQS
jgi:hypothetical protein